MEARKTRAFQSFDRSFQQSVALAQVISRGGLATIEDHVSHANTLSEEATGVDLLTFQAFPEEQRREISDRVTADAAARLEQIANELAPVAALGSVASEILFIFLVTIFEAYIEDILTTIYQQRPDLLKRIAGRQKDGDIRERVHQLLNFKRLDYIGYTILTQNLEIPFDKICKSANTSSAELDIAKAIRNIHIHNQGKVDKRFLERTQLTTLQVGDLYPVTIEYLLDLKDKIYFVAFRVDMLAIAQYSTIR